MLASAHAVVLASGTLAPIASLQQQLFPHVPPERIRHFSCGHVVQHCSYCITPTHSLLHTALTCPASLEIMLSLHEEAHCGHGLLGLL